MTTTTEITSADLDAIEAKWKGYEGPLYVAATDDGETVITAADDGSPYVSRVAVMDDIDEHTEVVARLFADAGQETLRLVAEVRRLRADNARLDDVAHGALDDLAAVRRELDAARGALRHYAPRCLGCGALATRTVGYDDCEPSTLRRVCDREVCGRGLPVSGESAHAAAVRAAASR